MTEQTPSYHSIHNLNLSLSSIRDRVKDVNGAGFTIYEKETVLTMEEDTADTPLNMPAVFRIQPEHTLHNDGAFWFKNTVSINNKFCKNISCFMDPRISWENLAA